MSYYLLVIVNFLVHTINLIFFVCCGCFDNKDLFEGCLYWRPCYLSIFWLLVFFIVRFTIKGVNDAEQHNEEVKIVTQNFAGKCTDDLTKYDFNIDFTQLDEDA